MVGNSIQEEVSMAAISMAASVLGLRSRFGEWWQSVTRVAHAMWAIFVILPMEILDGWITRRAENYLAHRSEDVSADLFMTMLWLQLRHRNKRLLLRPDEFRKLYADRAKELGRELDKLVAAAEQDVVHQEMTHR